MTCAHCGHPITGERKTKKTKAASGPTSTTAAPNTRSLVIRVFASRKPISTGRCWPSSTRCGSKTKRSATGSALVLASQTRDAQAESLANVRSYSVRRRCSVQQQDRLLNLRLAEDIDQETFARKHTEIRDRLASIKLQLDVLDRSHDETAELASKVFELSQTLRQQWLTADYAAKRRILEIVFLNCRLDDVTLVPTMRKPFDVLAEGLLSKNSRGDRI